MTMTAMVATARAICLDCALSIDLATATGEEAWTARAALLTPIAKAFGTDAGCEVSALAMQVFGGMGYVEETGVAQYYRDVRVTAIYEGTNGIQAMDLVGRKLADGGATAHRLIEATEETARRAAGELGAKLAAAAQRLAEATGWMAAAEINDRFAGAAPYLRAFALTLGGGYLLKAALAEGDEGPRAALAAFHIRQMLPQVGGALRRCLRRRGVALRLRPRLLNEPAGGRVSYPFAEPPARARRSRSPRACSGCGCRCRSGPTT